MCCLSKRCNCSKILKVFGPIFENLIVNILFLAFQFSHSRVWVTFFFLSTPLQALHFQSRFHTIIRMHEKITASPNQFCTQTIPSLIIQPMRLQDKLVCP